MPALTTLVRQQDNRAVAHAAFLALDRLTLMAPSSTLAMLLDNPDSMTGREQTRANYFARANLGDPTQREIVERYLLDPRRQASELQSFAGRVSERKLHDLGQPLDSGVDTGWRLSGARADREALAVIESWMKDERFRHQQRVLEMQERLRSFVVDAPQ